MSTFIPLNFRAAAYAQDTDEVPILLFKIMHEDLDAPVHLSSDDTITLEEDPRRVGTRCQGIDWDYALMGAIVPDDIKDAPRSTKVVFENVDRRMSQELRKMRPGTFAYVDLQVVYSSNLESPMHLFKKMRCVSGNYDAAEVSIEINREPYSDEPFSGDRMTVDMFPGLFE